MATIEKKSPAASSHTSEQSDSDEESGYQLKLRQILHSGQVEQNGIAPIPIEDRTSTRFINIFTVWCSANTNILGITFGMLGPLVYGLSLRDSALTILFFNLLTVLPPAYLAMFGPRTGMRQMVLARYAFGRYLTSVPVVCNLATLIGFNIIICIVGGQCLSAVSDGQLTPNVGIVVVAVLSLLVSFWGYKVLHIFETYAFIGALITITIATGYAGDGLKLQAPAPQATAAGVLSFGMIVASYQIPWGVIACDVTTYFNPKVPSWRVFLYTYVGLALPTILLMTLGAALAGALPNNPDWQKGYDENQVGGLLAGVLARAGTFGKVVLTLLTLTLLGNTCAAFYAITLNFQTLIPWLFRVPRYVFSILATAIIITVSILAVDNFFESLENVVSLIGYWSSAFVGVIISEHVFFRKTYAAYDPADWKTAAKLPWGVAAVAAAFSAIAVSVPMMDQTYWHGPGAKVSGDIAFELSLVLSFLFYYPLRWAERKYSGR